MNLVKRWTIEWGKGNKEACRKLLNVKERKIASRKGEWRTLSPFQGEKENKEKENHS